MSLPTPNTRKEQYLDAIATGNAGGLPTPITREEEYLDAIAKSGGGSGDGDMKKSVYDSDLAVANAGGIGAFVSDAISGKVDKVEGKGLSTNDYDNTEKGKVADNTGAIEAIVNVYGAKNVCPFPSLSELKAINTLGTWNNNVYSYYGATFTVDETNKTISIEKSTQSGSGNALIYLARNIDFGNTVIATIASTLQTANGWTISDGNDIASKTVTYGVAYDTNGNDVYTFIGGNQVLSSAVTIKPMIRDARITDPTYVPYAMTNRELTERTENNAKAIEKIGKVEAISPTIGNSSTDPIYIPYYKYGLYIVGSNNDQVDGNLYIFSVLQSTLLMLDQKEIDGTGSTGVRLVFTITNDNKIQISNNGFWGAILNILIIHR